MSLTVCAPVLGSRLSLAKSTASFKQRSGSLRAPGRFVCKAEKSEQVSLAQKLAVPFTAAAAAALLMGAIVPEDALAARSGGRMGGSSFRSAAPRAAPRAAPAPSRSGPAVRNYNYYNTAPPLVGGYGYSPFGFGGYGGGFSIFPSVGFPVFGLGGFFQLFFTLFLVSTVFNIIKSVVSSRSRDDEFDD